MGAWSADGFIIDQDGLEGYEYRTINASRNGCGPVAVFNILHGLGRDAEFSAVIEELDGLHRVHRPGPTAMNAMRAYLARHLPEMREHTGRGEALEASRKSRAGILRYTEERIPHFVSFLRQEGGGYRFFNVNEGLEDYVCSMEMFFELHVGTRQYVSAFTME